MSRGLLVPGRKVHIDSGAVELTSRGPDRSVTLCGRALKGALGVAWDVFPEVDRCQQCARRLSEPCGT